MTRNSSLPDQQRDYSAIEKQTKAIYVDQHKTYLEDRSIFDRFYRIAVDPNSYGLTLGDIKGKTVCDVGCGNSAYFQKAMFDLGAKHITCVDIGEDWKPALMSALDSLEVPRDFYTLLSGTTEQIGVPTESFDFVASNGVIMHLESVGLAEKAISELSRITKVGGNLYVYVGLDSPGIVDRYVISGLRNAYKEDPDFRTFVDNVEPLFLKSTIEQLAQHAQEQNDPSAADGLFALREIITLDTCTFLKNLLQVPCQQGPLLGLDWARRQFKANGFDEIRRCPNLYWKRNDVRKFLSPVHHQADNPLSQLFYGRGHIKMTGKKVAPFSSSAVS